MRAGLSADRHAFRRASTVYLIGSRRSHLDAEVGRVLGWIMTAKIRLTRGVHRGFVGGALLGTTQIPRLDRRVDRWRLLPAPVSFFSAIDDHVGDLLPGRADRLVRAGPVSKRPGLPEDAQPHV